jgi:hypothetical protein
VQRRDGGEVVEILVHRRRRTGRTAGGECQIVPGEGVVEVPGRHWNGRTASNDGLPPLELLESHVDARLPERPQRAFEPLLIHERAQVGEIAAGEAEQCEVRAAGVRVHRLLHNPKEVLFAVFESVRDDTASVVKRERPPQKAPERQRESGKRLQIVERVTHGALDRRY